MSIYYIDCFFNPFRQGPRHLHPRRKILRVDLLFVALENGCHQVNTRQLLAISELNFSLIGVVSSYEYRGRNQDALLHHRHLISHFT